MTFIFSHFHIFSYLSERESADRNFALAYYMRENKVNIDLNPVLIFHANCVSIITDSEIANLLFVHLVLPRGF